MSKNDRLLKALGEFGVIVLGVVVALTADAWYQARSEQREGAALVVALREELELNLAALDLVAGRAEEARLAVSDLLEMSGPDAGVPTPGVVDSLIFSGSLVTSFDPATGIIDQILGPGRLALVESEEIRAEITRWDELLRDLREDESRTLDIVEFLVVPTVSPLVRAYTRDGGGWAEPTPAEDVRLLLTDLEFANLLGVWRTRLGALNNAQGEIRAYMERLIQLIDEESV